MRAWLIACFRSVWATGLRVCLCACLFRASGCSDEAFEVSSHFRAEAFPRNH